MFKLVNSSNAKRFSRAESGATLVEYGVALILAIVVGGAGLSSLAAETSENMTESETAINFR